MIWKYTTIGHHSVSNNEKAIPLSQLQNDQCKTIGMKTQIIKEY